MVQTKGKIPCKNMWKFEDRLTFKILYVFMLSYCNQKPKKWYLWGFSILSINYLNQPMLLHQMCRNFLILQFEIIVCEILRITIHTIWFLTNLNFSQRQNVFFFGICDIGCHYFKIITSALMYFYVKVSSFLYFKDHIPIEIMKWLGF